nr:DUF192 domain-containing protein [Jannaschia aquimarina]
MHRLVLGVAAALAFAGSAVAAECRSDKVDVRGPWGTAQFTVELALNPTDQARGLMFRESLPRMGGMLFVYPRATELGFWMRNTLIPLDMIFADETGTVIKVHAEARPGDETVIRSEGDALSVLEINGGLAERLGIGPGDVIRSPALPQDGAAWPCDETASQG